MKSPIKFDKLTFPTFKVTKLNAEGVEAYKLEQEIKKELAALEIESYPFDLSQQTISDEEIPEFDDNDLLEKYVLKEELGKVPDIISVTQLDPKEEKIYLLNEEEVNLKKNEILLIIKEALDQYEIAKL